MSKIKKTIKEKTKDDNMSEIQKTTKDIRKTMDNLAGYAEFGIDMLFSLVDEEEVQRAEKSMKKCKKVCKAIGIIVLAICVVIVYLHLKG